MFVGSGRAVSVGDRWKPDLKGLRLRSCPTEERRDALEEEEEAGRLSRDEKEVEA